MQENWEIHWKDYYKVLQLDPSAESEAIEAVYTRLSRKYHPDTSKDPHASERMKELNEAHDILGNPEKRIKYDAVWRAKQSGRRNASSTPPIPVAEPGQIRFADASRGDIKKASFIVKNIGGPFSKVLVNNPNSWLKVTGSRSLSSSEKLPMQINIEAAAGDWDRVYVDYVVVKLDNAEFRVRIELQTKPKPVDENTTSGPSEFNQRYAPAPNTIKEKPRKNKKTLSIIAGLFSIAVVVTAIILINSNKHPTNPGPITNVAATSTTTNPYTFTSTIATGNSTTTLPQFATTTSISTRTTTPNTKPGSLSVNAGQSGASIYLGTQLLGTTDSWSELSADSLAPGTYTLKITASGYKDWSKQIIIAGNQTTTVYAYLENGSGNSATRNETIPSAATFGTLAVNTNAGASVFVGNEFGGTTNSSWGSTSVEGLISGKYTLKITESGYKDWTKQVTITDKQTTTVYAYLESGTGTSTTRNETIPSEATYGTLSVNSTPGSASIFVGTELDGTTSSYGDTNIKGLLPGTYTLKVTESGYKDWTKQLTITGNQTTTVYIYLESGSGASTTRTETIPAAATYGTLSVNSSPGGASIYIGTEFDGNTSSYGDGTVRGLLPGPYVIRVIKSGYVDWTQQITITAGQTATITVTLNK